jgi:L-2-hydroxycarboxylate dehydrogenase (NAD+)
VYTETVRVQAEELKEICRNIFTRLGESDEGARVIADVLVSADLRGVDSHGTQRVGFYVRNIRAGVIRPGATPTLVSETPTTALFDGQAGMGQPVSKMAMDLAIAKAKAMGMGFVTVRNSNHFGIAGYYAMQALDAGCIGMAFTNSQIFVVPTFGRDSMLGTNPISFAAPAARERPFVLDMATSTVPIGRLEVFSRLEKPIPLGWAADEDGLPTTDPGRVVDNLYFKDGRGGLTALGGDGELMGGHKGYGLAMMVDILCGVLPGALYANRVYPKDAEGRDLPSGLGHAFIAVRVDAFQPLEDFTHAMDDLEQRMRNAPKAAGQERIYTHGEKEFERTEQRTREGIPLNRKVWDELRQIGGELGYGIEDK